MQDALIATGFWAPDPVDEQRGLDGANWLIEGRRGSVYRVSRMPAGPGQPPRADGLIGTTRVLIVGPVQKPAQASIRLRRFSKRSPRR